MSFLYPEYIVLIIPIILYMYQNNFNLKIHFHLIILILILISLSRPIANKYEQNSEINGKNVVIALDISYSMKANDIKPNRYEFAKECIKELLHKNQNDNVMLIVFTTNPLLLSPPTTDHKLILTALKTLNLEYILTKGTSLEKLFLKLKDIGIKDKNFILITDGGDENNVDKLTSIIKNQTKSFTILALGSMLGSTITKEDNTLLKDSNGNLVISRINPLLKKLANNLKANYVVASNSIEKTVNELDNYFETDNKSTKKEYRYFELYQIPLFIAIVLFFMLHTKWKIYLTKSKSRTIN